LIEETRDPSEKVAPKPSIGEIEITDTTFHSIDNKMITQASIQQDHFEPVGRFITPPRQTSQDAVSSAIPSPLQQSVDDRWVLKTPTNNLRLPSLRCDQSELNLDFPSCKLAPRRQSKTKFNELLFQ
jgi:hypothetical protein